MSLGFYCVSNAQGYTLTAPSLRDLWGQTCTWLGTPSPHSTRVIPAESMGNPELVHLLTTQRLVLDPKSHAQQFREDVAVLTAQYAEDLAGLYAQPEAVSVQAGVAPTAAELAAEEAAALAEAQALADAEAAAATRAAKAAEEAEAAAKAAEEATKPVEPSPEKPVEPSTKKKR
jgi:hypothetical protein